MVNTIRIMNLKDLVQETQTVVPYLSDIGELKTEYDNKHNEMGLYDWSRFQPNDRALYMKTGIYPDQEIKVEPIGDITIDELYYKMYDPSYAIIVAVIYNPSLLRNEIIGMAIIELYDDFIMTSLSSDASYENLDNSYLSSRYSSREFYKLNNFLKNDEAYNHNFTSMYCLNKLIQTNETLKAFIKFVSVKSKYQNKGVASMLFENMCYYLKEILHVHFIETFVAKRNEGSLKLHVKYGFKIYPSGSENYYLVEKELF